MNALGKFSFGKPGASLTIISPTQMFQHIFLLLTTHCFVSHFGASITKQHEVEVVFSSIDSILLSLFVFSIWVSLLRLISMLISSFISSLIGSDSVSVMLMTLVTVMADVFVAFVLPMMK